MSVNLNDPKLMAMGVSTMAREEMNYIEETLKACNEDLPIKTYTVIRETTHKLMVEKIDEMIDKNPLLQLAIQPLNLSFMNIHKWIAILVEYEELEPEKAKDIIWHN